MLNEVGRVAGQKKENMYLSIFSDRKKNGKVSETPERRLNCSKKSIANILMNFMAV